MLIQTNFGNNNYPVVIVVFVILQNSKGASTENKASFLDLFCTPNMRKKSLSIFFNWVVCGMGLFGMAQYIGHVGGNVFLNFALSGAIQVPGNFFSWWSMNALGRKMTLITSNAMAGIASLLLIVVPDGEEFIAIDFYFVFPFIYSPLFHCRSPMAETDTCMLWHCRHVDVLHDSLPLLR